MEKNIEKLVALGKQCLMEPLSLDIINMEEILDKLKDGTPISDFRIQLFYLKESYENKTERVKHDYGGIEFLGLKERYKAMLPEINKYLEMVDTTIE
jgi:hypothetical protein